MTEVTKSTAKGRVAGTTASKIDRYNLADFVWGERMEGKSISEISKKCNAMLDSREDDQEYKMITVRNIFEFCRRMQHAITDKKSQQCCADKLFCA